MKNNKITQYLLLILVIVLWAMIFYRIFFKEEDGLPLKLSNDKTMVEEEVFKDTFSLNLNYKDPFLKYSYTENNETLEQEVTVKRVESKPIPILVKEVEKEVVWPSIKYGGLIKNSNTGKQVIVLSFNNKESIYSIGDQYNGIKIRKIYKDSVVLEYNNKFRTIKK